MGCDIVTVSTDTKFVHLAWQRDEKELAGVKYSMGSDPTGNVSRAFGVYDEATGLDLRGTFLIAPDGRVALRYRKLYSFSAKTRPGDVYRRYVRLFGEN